jgi:hypothetical protein
MKTIIDRIRDMVVHFSDQGFFSESEEVAHWLEMSSERTFDNINKLEWREVYEILHGSLDYIGEALEELEVKAHARAKDKACTEQVLAGLAAATTVTTPYPSCACCDDAALAQIVIDRLVESEVFYILLATALKGRLCAY